MMKKRYIAIRNGIGVYDRLIELGYKTHRLHKKYWDTGIDWIFIRIKDDNHEYYGEMVLNGSYTINKYDLELDIGDVPYRKDLDDFVSMLNESNKMGLL